MMIMTNLHHPILKSRMIPYLHQKMNRFLFSTINLWQKNLPKNHQPCPKTNQTSHIDKIKIMNLSTCLMNWFSTNQLTVPTAATFSTFLTEKLKNRKKISERKAPFLLKNSKIFEQNNLSLVNKWRD